MNVNSLDTLIAGLVDRLNNEHPKAKEAAMIDIGGCVFVDGMWNPVVHQIDRSSGQSISSKSFRSLKNSDSAPYAWLFVNTDRCLSCDS